MALELVKLAITATSTATANVTTDTTTDVDANIQRFLALFNSSMVVGSNTIVNAADFDDDDGNDVLTGGLPVPVDGYYNVYINGVLQEGGLSTLTSNELTIATDQIGVDGTPIVLEVIDYAGTTSTSTSTATVDVTTTLTT